MLSPRPCLDLLKWLRGLVLTYSSSDLKRGCAYTYGKSSVPACAGMPCGALNWWEGGPWGEMAAATAAWSFRVVRWPSSILHLRWLDWQLKRWTFPHGLLGHCQQDALPLLRLEDVISCFLSPSFLVIPKKVTRPMDKEVRCLTLLLLLLYAFPCYLISEIQVTGMCASLISVYMFQAKATGCSINRFWCNAC